MGDIRTSGLERGMTAWKGVLQVGNHYFLWWKDQWPRVCACVCTCREMHYKHMSKVNVLETCSKAEAAKEEQYVRAGGQSQQ